MTIYFDDWFDMNSSMTGLMKRAAEECIKREGAEALDPERCSVSVSFALKDEIQSMNKRYRGVDSVTDVLSFPQYSDFSEIPAEGDILLGDVVICMERAIEQAKEYGHSQERELIYLFTHSVLHLLGYDHMEEGEKREMRTREEEIMTAIGLPQPK